MTQSVVGCNESVPATVPSRPGHRAAATAFAALRVATKCPEVLKNSLKSKFLHLVAILEVDQPLTESAEVQNTYTHTLNS